jgi:eukaryotic-like serine/threonine-protein kinase
VIGTFIKHYRIDEVVGQGGMGVVYRALDVNLERTVALKVLSTLLRNDPAFVERFRQEARIQAGLNHPNIATLFDFFVWNDQPVAVMEFITGETLRSMVNRSGPIPAHIALPIFVQALRGVAAGHKRHIIHRDLKPSNLMVTDEGIVKVTDFGIAKVRSATGLTEDSTRVGSASYMAPEQILGRPVDVRTDIYIMGGTLYELLTGRPPFQGMSQFEIESAHVREPPKAPTALCPHIPPAAVDAVMRALAKKPSNRFASAEEFIQALPDLHGVPYVVVEAPEPVSSGAAADDETRRQQASPIASAPRSSTAADSNVQPQQNALKIARTRRAGTAAVAVLVVSTAGIGIFLYSARQRGVGPPPPQSTQAEPPTQTRQIQSAVAPDTTVSTPPNTPVTGQLTTHPKLAERVTPAPSPPLESSRGLTGVWTGTYLDRSGKSLLQLQNLQMQQVDDGTITGRFTYKAGNSAGEQCSLDKSSYSTQSRHLRLIVHCRNPNHPKYLNVPLEFTDVDPNANSIEGGRLAFHLADNIVVTLERTKGT